MIFRNPLNQITNKDINLMNKKRWRILIIIAIALAIGLTLYFLLRPTA